MNLGSQASLCLPTCCPTVHSTEHSLLAQCLCPVGSHGQELAVPILSPPVAGFLLTLTRVLVITSALPFAMIIFPLRTELTMQFLKKRNRSLHKAAENQFCPMTVLTYLYFD